MIFSDPGAKNSACLMEVIKVNGTAQAIGADKSVDISVPIIYAQANQPAGLKAGDMWFQIIE